MREEGGGRREKGGRREEEGGGEEGGGRKEEGGGRRGGERREEDDYNNLAVSCNEHDTKLLQSLPWWRQLSAQQEQDSRLSLCTVYPGEGAELWSVSDVGLVASKAMFLGDMLSSNTGTRSAASWCSLRNDRLSSSTRLSNTPCIHTCSACVHVMCVCV